VLEELPDGSRRVLRVLGPGEAFGELAIVRRSPRAASVETLEPTELFAVDTPTFDRLLAPQLRIPEFAPTVQQAADLADVRCLSSLSLSELLELVRAGEWRSTPPGAEVVTQGADPDGFYLLLEGRAEVLVDDMQVAVLERGAHFGELALLSGGRRAATVRTLTPARLFFIDTRAFRAMLGHVFDAGPAIQAQVREEDRRS